MEKSTTEIAEAVPAVDVPAPTPVGEQLRLAREAAHLSLDDVARVLKLGARQIEALEGGDWGRLPGHTFVRGFVRNYARHLNLDSAPLMVQLDQVIARPEDVLAVPEPTEAAIPFVADGSARDRRVVLAGFLALCIAGLLYFAVPADLSALRDSLQEALGGFNQPAAPAVQSAAAPAAEPVFPPGTTPQQVMTPQALMPPEPANAPSAASPAANPAAVPAAPTAVSPAPAPAASPTAVAPMARTTLEFVADKQSWVEVKDRDGRTLFSQRLVAGSRQSVAGDGPLSVVVGFAPGVKLSWRGQAVDLEPHTRGDVARLVLE